MLLIRKILIPAIVASLFVVGACSGKDGADAAQAKRGGPAQVGYVVVQPTSVPLQTTLGGRTVAFETSEVRPQVNGLIRQKLFTEGAFVRQGQSLFQIDPSLYRAAEAQAIADTFSSRPVSPG